MKLRDLTVGQLVDILQSNPDLIDERFAPYCCELQDGRVNIDGILDLDKEVDYGKEEKNS